MFSRSGQQVVINVGQNAELEVTCKSLKRGIGVGEWSPIGKARREETCALGLEVPSELSSNSTGCFSEHFTIRPIRLRLDGRLLGTVSRDDLIAFKLNTVFRRFSLEGGLDATLPIDERAVAIESDYVAAYHRPPKDSSKR